MIPNYLLENILRKTKDKAIVKQIIISQEFIQSRKTMRVLRRKGLLPVTEPTHNETISVYDNLNNWDYVNTNLIERFTEIHTHEAKKYPTTEVTRLVDAVYDMFHDIYGRESFDNRNNPVRAYINFGVEYDNAFWDGLYLAFGNGDGEYFRTFLIPDVIAHEFGHAVQDYENAFIYMGQAGALNEHLSDVFGITFDQIYKKTDVNTSKWLIGEGIWTDKVKGVALRSMKDPGTAYDDPIMGTDPQPAHMDDYMDLPLDDDNDNGGVHINSGIPNKAFYLANLAMGGRIHENGVGKAWYNTALKSSGLGTNPTFQQFAEATVKNAESRLVANAIRDAWLTVGIHTADLPPIEPPVPPIEPPVEPPVEPPNPPVEPPEPPVEPPTEPPVDPPVDPTPVEPSENPLLTFLRAVWALIRRLFGLQ